MNTTTFQGYREQLTDLQARLSRVHVGLSPEIQRVTAAITPWLMLADAQTRPRVVGLWGMTGTGKSSLVRALVRELALEDRTFWLDAGECHDERWMDGMLERLAEHHNGSPFILVVDEFQHARTVRAGVEQEEPGELRRLWELIDAGRAVLDGGGRWGLTALLDLHDNLALAFSQGVVVRNGRVVSGHAVHHKLFGTRKKGEVSAEHWAVPKDQWDTLRDRFSQRTSLAALQRRMEQMDGPELLDLVLDHVRANHTPLVLDASKALVFVLGNLDGLYVTGRDPMPELDPDVLLDRHHRIGVTGIQQELMKLFRVEQVARLGTDHVVFPPMGRDTTRALVQREVDAMVLRLGARLQARVEVSGSLVERIGREAAIPILGARPVVDAVHQVLPSLLAQALMDPDADGADHIRLELEGDRPVVLFHHLAREVSVSLAWPLQREPNRVERERVFRHAVHEVGHVLCGMLLNGGVPLQACARTSSDSIGGFVIWADRRSTLTRADVVPHLAQLLGGWVAERMIYGDDGVSDGSSNDLERASAMALELLKGSGFGAARIFQTEHPEAPGCGFRTDLSATEDQARTWIEEAEKQAYQMLNKERARFDLLVAALVKRGSLNGPQINAIMVAQETGPSDAHPLKVA